MLFRSVRLLDKGFSLPSFFSVSIQDHFSTGSSNTPNGIMNTGLGSFELFSLELPFSVLLFLCFPSEFLKTGSFTNGSALAVTTVELLWSLCEKNELSESKVGKPLSKLTAMSLPLN